MLKKLLLVILTITYFQLNLVTAQKYLVKDGTDISEHSARTIFVTPTNEYMDVDYEVNKQGELVKATVTKYNNQLKQIASGPLPELLGKTFLTSYTAQNKNYLVAIDQTKAVYQYEVDATGNEPHIASSQPLFSKTDKFGRYNKGFSPDSSLVYIICNSYDDEKDESETITGVVLNKEAKISSKFSFTIPIRHDKIMDLQTLLTNSGKLAVVCASENNEKGAYKPIAFTITGIDADGKIKPSVNLALPEGLVTNPAWTIKGDKIFYNCLLSKKEKRGYTTAATGAYDLGQFTQGVVEEESLLNAPYLQGGSKSLERISKDGITYLASYKKSFSFSDGSCMALLEAGDDNFVTSSHGGAFNSLNSYSVNYHSLGAVYAIKWGPQGKVQWIKVVRKAQEEPSLNLYTSFACIRDNKDGVHVLFHDRVENMDVDPDEKIKLANVGDIKSHSLAAVYISRDGKMKKQFILDNEPREFQFSPKKAYNLAANELVFISIKHKMIGHDSYSIGKITVK